MWAFIKHITNKFPKMRKLLQVFRGGRFPISAKNLMGAISQFHSVKQYTVFCFIDEKQFLKKGLWQGFVAGFIIK